MRGPARSQARHCSVEPGSGMGHAGVRSRCRSGCALRVRAEVDRSWRRPGSGVIRMNSKQPGAGRKPAKPPRTASAPARPVAAAGKQPRSKQNRGPPPTGSEQGSGARHDAEHEELAREILRSRRARQSLFSAALFGEPAWELLLEIFVADCSGRRLSITSACLIADVPQTTALRWLARLEREGLVLRVQDQSDRRRAWVSLTERARTAVIGYFQLLKVKLA